MDRHGDAVYRYAVALLRDRHQAEDILQTVFLDAFQSLQRYEGRSSFKVWLLGIARHRCLDAARRRNRWKRLLGGADLRDKLATDAVVKPAPVHADPEVGPHLEDCLGRLSPAARDGVLLRFRQELSFEEMASVTGQTSGALRVRVFRGLEALRRCLDQKGVTF